MPELKNYRLFISHSWTYSDMYERLVGFFDDYPLFKWTNYSVPKGDPIHNAPNEKDLYEAIKNQIVSVNSVVMLAGVYSTYSKWINKEIEISKRVYNKPIIAVEPWGSEKTSAIVKNDADIIVKWNSSSIVDAIRKYAI
ncbi:MAG: hypothetical protein Ta2G_17980 [Termitinemataceae bacterium]|nr:MAG: hypothetical protein Ta2G_17980 [Termitinemataceae bacterium]